MSEPTRPHMSMVNTRPGTVLFELVSINSVFVQCRLPDGTDAWVPLLEIFEQFQAKQQEAQA